MIRSRLGPGVVCLCFSVIFGGFVSADETTAFDIEMSPGDRLAFRGALFVHPEDEDFGGLSGMVMDGLRDVIAISDRARWARFTLDISDGHLTGLSQIRTYPIITHKGQEGYGRDWDAEGLARAADDTLWVSFERVHRVQQFDAVDASAGRALRPEKWKRLINNSGLEALAIANDGRLWAIEEQAQDDNKPFRVFIAGTTIEETKFLPRNGDFLPTGADFGPDGWLYVTQRAFSFVSGFRISIRRLKWGDGPAPTEDQELATFEAVSRIDNIEAISVWREDETTYAVVLSDDNFNIFQRNVVALFEVLP